MVQNQNSSTPERKRWVIGVRSSPGLFFSFHHAALSRGIHGQEDTDAEKQTCEAHTTKSTNTHIHRADSDTIRTQKKHTQRENWVKRSHSQSQTWTRTDIGTDMGTSNKNHALRVCVRMHADYEHGRKRRMLQITRSVDNVNECRNLVHENGSIHKHSHDYEQGEADKTPNTQKTKLAAIANTSTCTTWTRTQTQTQDTDANTDTDTATDTDTLDADRGPDMDTVSTSKQYGK